MPRHKHTAVARNRVKRRLRELVRLELLPSRAARAPLDIVLRAMPSAYQAAVSDLASDVRRAIGRLEGSAA